MCDYQTQPVKKALKIGLLEFDSFIILLISVRFSCVSNKKKISVQGTDILVYLYYCLYILGSPCTLFLGEKATIFTISN